MEEVLDTLKKLEINYELVNHKAVYTIEDMNNLNKEIFKGAEICKNLFLRDQKGKRQEKKGEKKDNEQEREKRVKENEGKKICSF